MKSTQISQKCQISTLHLILSGIDPLFTHFGQKLLLSPLLYWTGALCSTLLILMENKTKELIRLALMDLQEWQETAHVKS